VFLFDFIEQRQQLLTEPTLFDIVADGQLLAELAQISQGRSVYLHVPRLPSASTPPLSSS